MIYRDTTAIEAVNNGRDTPDAFYDPKHPTVLMATSKWHKTDAWRGYNVLTPEPGYKVIDDNWVTGDWDDAIAEEHGETPTEARLAKLEQEHGELYIIYTPTSNVFSTGIDVLVKDQHAPIAQKGELVAHKTRRFTYLNGDWKVRYHATDVVSYCAATGKYTLNSGGWNTLTTSKRMTEYLPYGYSVYRRNWVLYVRTPDGEQELKDGMLV